jgi:hypothetical protein
MTPEGAQLLKILRIEPLPYLSTALAEQGLQVTAVTARREWAIDRAIGAA